MRTIPWCWKPCREALNGDTVPGVNTLSNQHHDSTRDQTILVVDFGSQTAQLICRRIRELGTYAVMVAPSELSVAVAEHAPQGIVLSGGPSSVYEEGAPELPLDVFEHGCPVLGICYGMQAACRLLGAEITSTQKREFGDAHLTIQSADTPLLKGVPDRSTVWMSHGDHVSTVGEQFTTIASTPNCENAIVRHNSLSFYGIQFHPEVTHTAHGRDMLANFLVICGCTGTWRMADFLNEQVEHLREVVGEKHVICGLSGGVDSSVVAAILSRAIGDQLTCVLVDNGLLRKQERERVEVMFNSHFDSSLIVADDGERFLDKLQGVEDPQEKRRIIGHQFIDSFTRVADELQGRGKSFAYLAQGTLYPDVIESGHGHAKSSANIKLHHNVGGLPDELGFDLIEPLRDLFKDEVRALGRALGLPRDAVNRHPFPGPGLAVRVLGEITEERLRVLRDADEILLEEIVAAELYDKTAQVFAVFLPVRSVGVMGDGRTYENVIAVRAVTTSDFMTADWAHIPHEVLAKISNRIINEVRGVNRVVYDISSKPPATIEWE